MYPLVTVPEAIGEITLDLRDRGCAIDSIELGTKELEDMREWAEPEYRLSIDYAIEVRLPFYWHGHKIVPVSDCRAFRVLI